jgi:hypothetical protein
VLLFQLLFLRLQLLLLPLLLLMFACRLHTLTFMPALNVSAVTSCKHKQQNTQQHACQSGGASRFAAPFRGHPSSKIFLN